MDPILLLTTTDLQVDMVSPHLFIEAPLTTTTEEGTPHHLITTSLRHHILQAACKRARPTEAMSMVAPHASIHRHHTPATTKTSDMEATVDVTMVLAVVTAAVTEFILQEEEEAMALARFLIALITTPLVQAHHRLMVAVMAEATMAATVIVSVKAHTSMSLMAAMVATVAMTHTTETVQASSNPAASYRARLCHFFNSIFDVH